MTGGGSSYILTLAVSADLIRTGCDLALGMGPRATVVEMRPAILPDEPTQALLPRVAPRRREAFTASAHSAACSCCQPEPKPVPGKKVNKVPFYEGLRRGRKWR